jgi:hypothetical protein
VLLNLFQIKTGASVINSFLNEAIMRNEVIYCTLLWQSVTQAARRALVWLKAGPGLYESGRSGPINVFAHLRSALSPRTP